MTDTEKIVKINDMVETCCASWNGHMKGFRYWFLCSVHHVARRSVQPVLAG